MHRYCLNWFIAISTLLLATQTAAVSLFDDDFQSGQYNQWTPSGDGSDAIHLYQGNYSLRLDGLRQAQLTLSTAGYENVSLAMVLTATELLYGDQCFAEYSVNGGASWTTLGSIGVAESGGPLVSFSQSAGLDDVNQLALRFRAYTLYDNYCYGDDVAVTGTPISQNSLFSDDFQDGDSSGWSFTGNGNNSVNLYQGNYSLRVDGLRQGRVDLSSAGANNVVLSAQLAALYLVNGDACHLEYSTDAGQSWQTLLTLNNGDDDGNFRSATINSGLDDNGGLSLRVRAYTLFGNYCYGDNITLSGTAGGQTQEPQLTVSGSGSFGAVAVGSTVNRNFTLRNSGDQTLEIGSITGASAPFSVNVDNCSNQNLAQAQSCQLEVAFTPVDQSSANDSLSIASNDTDQNPFLIALSGTGTQTGNCEFDCLAGDGSVSRSQLTYSQLTGSGAIALLNYSHYALPASGADPANTFSGNLSLTVVPGTLTEQGTNLASAYTNPDSLPPFDFDFVQYGSHLIPVDRQVTATGHPAWEWILLPGRVWNENGDSGYSRVALPFALQEINANCTHNGVMTFLFKDDGTVSDVAYQIAQETCEYFKFNLHGKLTANYTPAVIANDSQLKNDYVAELSNRLPRKALSELATDYPGQGVNVSAIGSDQTSVHLSAFGVLYQGVHYQGQCNTRQGAYPYCNVMALPSYSTAKSVVGGIGLMALEQQYGGSQAGLKISDYVSACSPATWSDVTFEQALDMATGNYDSAGDSVDEGAQKTINEFFLVASHADKISHACDYPRKSTPGTQFVYHTSDTYILSRAMQKWYEANQGAQADYYNDLLVEQIFKPIHLSPLTWQSKRSYDSERQVWGGYGLTFSGDDLLKIGQFLLLDEGKVAGQPMLDASLLGDALQQSSNRGLTTGTSSSRYQNGFWAYDLGASTQVSCSNPTWVPYMSGFGGIGLVILPNNMLYYYVSDNKEYGFTKTVRELDKIASVCN
ncbi:choice-of-anchor D domain-containing protein [Lacimicrobium sp. SS2-24]|uniref:choice-of-anchor D domain-containing protein n=1 Tax=Lacimicrobium sp. SS2-24 TaxID=2005569 RepID=UPI00143BFFF4|nr:choice-of-anchor D domain-containing protein [Lacimicrobium sp. SS2-24]